MFLKGFWEAFGVHFEVISASNLHIFFDVVFGFVLEAFWERFGLHLGAFWGHFGHFVGPKGYSERKHRFSRKPMFSNCFFMIFRVAGGQHFAILDPGGNFSTLGNDVDFWIDFRDQK